MPITIRVNEKNCLRIVAFDGVVPSAHVTQLVALYERNRGWLGHDSFYLLDADRIDIGPGELDVVRRRVFELYQDIDPFVLRRSAWIFANAHMRRLAEYWITGRHARDGGGAEFCLGDTLEDARALFSEDELALVRTGDGFRELARIDTLL